MWSICIEHVRDISCPSRHRKRGEELGERQLERIGYDVRELVSTNICTGNESPFLCINATVKHSVSNSVENLDAVRRSIFEWSTNDEEIDIKQTLAHSSVVDQLLEFPK